MNTEQQTLPPRLWSKLWLKLWHKLWFNLLLLATLLGGEALARPATPVNVVIAALTEMFPGNWVAGAVISNNDAALAAEVDGRLRYVAEVGVRVAKGELVAQIDDRVLRLQLNERQAIVGQSRHNYQFLLREVTRKQALATQQLSSRTDLDQSINARDIAKGDLLVAEARVAQTRLQLEYTRIVAPFAGVVTARLSQLGEVVANGTEVIRLVETDNLEVTAQIPLTSYQYLKTATELALKSPLGHATAPIRTVVPVADSRSRLMELRLQLIQNDWPVGLDVQVSVPSGPTETLLAVPRDSLVLRREGHSVFRINAQNQAEQIPVTLGIASGALIAVSGSLQAGDRVVVRGAERLQAGQSVSIKDNNDALVTLPPN